MEGKYFSFLLFLSYLVHSSSAAECLDPFQEVGDNCYYFSPEKLTWADARDYCVSLSTPTRFSDLATFDDSGCDFNIIIRQLTEIGENHYWLGGTDEAEEGNWFWVDERPVDLLAPFWAPEEPGDNTSNNCMMMYIADEYKTRWRVEDYGCINPHFFICQLL